MRGRALVFAEMHIHTPLVAEHVLFDREGVAGAIDHHQFIFLNHPLRHEFFHGGKSHRSGGFHRHAFTLGEFEHGVVSGAVAHAFHRATVFLRQFPQMGISLAGVAGGQDGNEGFRGHWVGHALARLKGLGHRRAPIGLGNAHLGHPVNQAHGVQFLKTVIHAHRPQAAADRLDIPIGRAPAELFHNLISDGFHGLARRDAFGAPVQVQAPAGGEVGGDLFGLVIVAADFDDLGPEERGLAQFVLRHEAGHEDPQFDAAARAGGSVGHGGIAGGSDDAFMNAGFEHGRHRHTRLPIFERTGGAMPLVFEI